MAHICKKCFLREMAEEDAKMIEKYKKEQINVKIYIDKLPYFLLEFK